MKANMRMVLPVRIELTTSPLPRGCSTTELRQQPDEMNALKTRRSLPYGGNARKRGSPARGCGATAGVL
jgi:hypothetical protein